MATDPGVFDVVDPHVRPVDEDEVARFRADGWVRLPGFVSRSLTAQLLERFQHRMGAEPTGDVLRHSATGFHRRPDFVAAMWRDYELPSEDDDLVRSFSRSAGVGLAVSSLLGYRVRFFSDEVVAKHPQRDGGAGTKWHQDAPYAPLDRSGIVTVWLALVDVTAEMGAMRFCTGSQRLGDLGRVVHLDGEDVFTQNPGLEDVVDISEPIELQAGDATVHDWRVVHGARANMTDRTRWAYTASYFRADALYTGARQRFVDHLELEVNRPLDHERFPMLEGAAGTAGPARGAFR